ncbi:hypothetical protein BH20CHL8_BH20CHL8_00990 [soil metagenome]
MGVRRLVAAAAVAALAGCSGVAPDGTPGASPSSDPFLEPRETDATGPLVDLGAGESFETGWRYAIYPREAGWCTQLEVTGAVTSRCEDLLPSGDETFGSIGRETSDITGATVFDGVVTEDVATVWLVFGPTARIPATLMALEGAGPDGQAFVGVVPASQTLTHMQALALNGQVLETLDLR